MKYITPEIEALEFDLLDVIQTSSTDPENPGTVNPDAPETGEDDLPWT